MKTRKPRSLVDFTGKKAGRWTFLEYRGQNEKRHSLWLVACDCGVTKVLPAYWVGRKGYSSCGCLRREVTAARNRVHGLSQHPYYSCWIAMMSRCFKSSHADYKNYGARGITVCERWKASVQNFIDDMGEKPSKAHSIERRDNSKGYSPDNCYWATAGEQGNNRRVNRLIAWNGETLTISQWSKKLNLHHDVIRSRLRSGTPIEKLFAPSRRKRIELTKV